MTFFAVIREARPMNNLADQGLVLIADPLAGSEHDRIRVLLVADADSEADIHRRFADDPWEQTYRLVTTSVEPWTVLVGKDGLRGQTVAHALTALPIAFVEAGERPAGVDCGDGCQGPTGVPAPCWALSAARRSTR
ncbi:YciI family protein [Kitasatospora azatica]|uniref:hypothetical protein n=1 Tax=Kitasatospora azatica TaxID=58347 RepID=UPI000691C2EC|nr:hypothetical protein [Kitasatospora azatica]